MTLTCAAFVGQIFESSCPGPAAGFPHAVLAAARDAPPGVTR